jgi:hypothetical protein
MSMIDLQAVSQKNRSMKELNVPWLDSSSGTIIGLFDLSKKPQSP